MKKNLFFAVLLIITGAAFSQNYTVQQSDYSLIKVSFSASDIQAQQIMLYGNPFCALTMDGFSRQSVSGKPALPSLVKIIEVPLGNGLKYEIVAAIRDTLDGNTLGISNPVVPAQPSRSKSDTHPAVLTMDSAAYSDNSFSGQPTIMVEEIGVARNRNLATIAFNPVSWNPVTNQIVIVRSITVAIRQKNADIEATKRMKNLHANREFGMGTEVINELEASSTSHTIGSTAKEARTTAPIRYTIVANSIFRGALDEFAAWKRRKGFMVDLVYTDEVSVGSTTTSISNYLKGLYDNASEAEPAPTYVLLVGDVAQLPAFQLSTQNYHYSDLNYVCWTSGDKIPDAYIGRFSAENLAQLTPQISKTLMYEQYTFPDDSYLRKAVLIAGIDGGSSTDFGYTHADPTMDYVAKNYVNSENGFTSITYYKNNPNNHPDGVTVTGSSGATNTVEALKSAYNSGCGLVNYSAHGSQTLWSSPRFTISDVDQMTNNDMPMVAIGNCCLTNSFQIGTCLGEAFLRKGNNAGGVAYIGASEVTYWDEDVYWSMGPRSNISASMSLNYNANNLGMYDQLFHTHGEEYSKWHITMGAMVFSGNMSVQSSTADNAMKNYYWEVYHLMGDPSLMPYIHGPAQTMEISAPDNIPLGSSSINLQCVPYAYVALTDEEHNLISATYADENGDALILINGVENIISGNYEIAVWAQGYKQLFQTITIAPTDTYIKAIALTPNTAIKAGQPVSFDLTVKNIGILQTDSIWIEFRSADGKMLIENTGLITIDDILEPGQELTLNNICSANVWNDVADGGIAKVNVFVYWGPSTSTRTVNKFHFDVAAAKIETLDNHLDGDGFNGTQSATISITSINSGHTSLEDATATLFSLDPTLNINNDSSIFTIAENDTIIRTFTITANGDVPTDRIIPFLYTITSADYSFTDSLLVVFGQPYQIVDFENNSWGGLNWTNGTYPWGITTSNPYEGLYCARSKNWSNGGGGYKTSETEFSIITSVDDSISFYYRVSSEENYDIFSFHIDNEMIFEASGEVAWTRAAFFIPAGNHTFKFSYYKDAYYSEGQDAAFIDYLKLPNTEFEYHYINDTICFGSNYTFADTTLNTDALNEGTHQFTHEVNNNVYYLTLTVLPTPNATIDGGDVSIMAGETVRLTATGGNRYLWSTGEHHPIIDLYPSSTTTISVTAFSGRCSSEASTTITIGGSIIGIDDNEEFSTLTPKLNIYPNPAKNILTIVCRQIKEIVITDIVGKVERKPANVDWGSSVTVDISDLPMGIHLLEVTTLDGKKQIAKFIKK